jgi:ornithine carbamoyltransferase
MSKRDLLSMTDLSATEIQRLLSRAAELKAARTQKRLQPILAGHTLGMIFEKASTRTRVSFEVAMVELGGHAVYLAPEGTQIGRGEPIRDTARVLGAYCSAIVLRTFAHSRLEELARFTPVPVINGLTDHSHPCQVLADLFTVYETHGLEKMTQLKYAWIGDGNNMAHSWINAAGILGLDLALACPAGYDPDPAVLESARKSGRGHVEPRIEIVRSPRAAAKGRHVINTDVWASMGQEDQRRARARAFTGYIVDEALVAGAAPDVMILHCLPAHRGEEIAESVLEGPNSAVFRQAENRLHVQKAILELLLAEGGRRPTEATPIQVK